MGADIAVDQLDASVGAPPPSKGRRLGVCRDPGQRHRLAQSQCIVAVQLALVIRTSQPTVSLSGGRTAFCSGCDGDPLSSHVESDAAYLPSTLPYSLGSGP